MYWLKRLLFWTLIIAPPVYVYQHRPTFEQHVRTIYAEAYGPGYEDRSDLMDLPEWQKLHFRDFVFVTTTSDTSQLNMISYGYLGRVKLSDDTWGPKTFNLVPPKD